MSLSTKKELLAALAPRYQKAGKKEKTRILDELTASAGYERKYAITALTKAAFYPPSPKKPLKRRRSVTYGDDVASAFLHLWQLARGLCPKRLVPFLPELLEALERHKEVSLPGATRAKLLVMSVSTAERLLQAKRRTLEKSVSTTSVGTLLRQQIPLHTFSEWKDSAPGFCEIDLVAHCGTSAAGQFLYTLTVTDVATGWTECCALPNRSQITVQDALDKIRLRLPFPLRGIDCDNGTEFINYNLKRYCDSHQIAFTRCRPYKKNDQCHVEQKNGAVVRALIGYGRYEGDGAVKPMNRLYAIHRLHLNYFCPSMKLKEKSREGAKVKKSYDAAQTPWQRLKGYKLLTEEETQKAQEDYEKLNPAGLGRRIEEAEQRLSPYGVDNYPSASGDNNIAVQGKERESQVTKQPDACSTSSSNQEDIMSLRQPVG